MAEPVLRSVPSSILTERLLLRCPRPGDGLGYFLAQVNSIEDLRTFPAFMPGILGKRSYEMAEKYC